MPHSGRKSSPDFRGDLARMFEQLYDAVEGNTVAEKLTTEISTLTMAYVTPSPDDTFSPYNLSKSERIIAEFLHSRLGREVTREVLMGALYFDRHGEDEPDPKIVNVHFVRLRRKLVGSPFEIQTAGYKRGWRMIEKERPAA